MIWQMYKTLVRRLLQGNHGYTFARHSWRTMTNRCVNNTVVSIQKCKSGSLVPSMCITCKKYHNETGNQSDRDVKDTVQVITNELDAELHEGSSEKVVDGPARNRRFNWKQDLHVPVMKDEVLSYLGEKSGQTFLDMTFGAGGHTEALLDSSPDCHVFALDRDPVAHSLAVELAEERPGQITPLLGRFSELPSLLASKGVYVGSIDGVLMDLGCSSMQFDKSERGFSLSMDGPLDMRMDADRLPEQATAADVVNTLDEADLIKIFKKYGEERNALKLAHAIVDARSAFGRITRTKELADIVKSVSEGGFRADSLGRYSHPATRIFQALRIFVNNELNELNCGIEIANRYLKIGGICVAISFHSLEDRIVKRHFHTIDIDEQHGLSISQRHRLLSSMPDFSKDQLASMIVRKWKPIKKKVTVPTDEEKEINPRSRSAKLRAAEKLEASH